MKLSKKLQIIVIVLAISSIVGGVTLHALPKKHKPLMCGCGRLFDTEDQMYAHWATGECWAMYMPPEHTVSDNLAWDQTVDLSALPNVN
jgi:hypothetical protein